MKRYLNGLGGQHETEAIEGALPRGRNSPQQPAFGLYAEQFSGTSFTMPRHQSLRSWLYRLRPTAMHAPFTPLDRSLRTAPCAESTVSPNRLRWKPSPAPAPGTDFIDGLFTYATAGNAGAQHGIGVHGYAASASMDRVFHDADGELLIVPQEGALAITTELGALDVAPGEIAVIPRGMRFKVAIEGPLARGYLCENYGAALRLPELGPIGANGLANARDFEVPVAAFEDRAGPVRWIAKLGGRLWTTALDHSPFDVVAWHGNCHPYKYDLARFNTVNTVSFDHPDPSIFTVLTSPSDTPGMANVDFVIFPPRWMVATDTFRPPYFHRNVMSEFMGLVRGRYDAKQEGFMPGGASLHNAMSAHGPDLDSWRKASTAKLEPHYLDATLAFMFETRYPLAATPEALAAPTLDRTYDVAWAGFPAGRVPK